MRALIDTCIIIDTLQARQPFCEESNRIFILAANQFFSAFISAKSVTDILNFPNKKSSKSAQSSGRLTIKCDLKIFREAVREILHKL